MFGMNVEWDHQQQQSHGHHHRPRPQQQSSGGNFFSNLFGGKKEEERMKAGHVYYYTSSRPNAPRRAETVSVLPAGVKMPKGNEPEVSYGADGSKYLVIPRRSNSTSRPRQIVVTSGGSTPKRKDSTASAHRSTPRRSNSTQVRPTSPPVASRAPKIVGDPELVKQYENSQRNVARWVESVGDSVSPRTSSRPRRTSTR